MNNKKLQKLINDPAFLGGLWFFDSFYSHYKEQSSFDTTDDVNYIINKDKDAICIISGTVNSGISGSTFRILYIDQGIELILASINSINDQSAILIETFNPII